MSRSPADAVPLRERKRAKTLQRIVTVATRMFFERGFEETTLEQIADAADVHKQTVLRYFPTKEAIAFARRNAVYAGFVAGLPHRKLELIEHMRVGMLENASDAEQRSYLRRWFAFVDSDPRLSAYNTQISRKYQDAIALALSEEAGLAPQTDIFSRSLAALIVFGFYDALRAGIEAGDHQMLVSGINQVADMAKALKREDFPASGVEQTADPARTQKGAAPRRRAGSG
jgi:AcrR family transcriptional regulator